MFGLKDSIETLFRSFSRGTTSESPESATLDVAIRTASAFAQVDLFFASSDKKASAEGGTPDSLQKVVEGAVAQIRADATTEVWDVADKTEKVIKGSQALEAVLSPTEPQDETVDRDFTESNLDARVLLGDGVRKGLENLLSALLHQLACCDASHLLRLQLSGFYTQLNPQPRLLFETYLSSRYTWIPPRWVKSRCSIASRALDTAAAEGCKIILDSEAENKDLHILLEDVTAHQAMPTRNTQELQHQEIAHRAPRVQVDGCCSVTSSKAPTKSLWELIRSGDPANRVGGRRERFLPDEREMLCLNLALSLLQLSTKPWNRALWTSDGHVIEGVFFLRDPATESVVDKTQPYLSYRLYSPPAPAQDESLVCDARLLDFGKLIMEIHMWETLPLPNEPRPRSREELRLHLLRIIHDQRRFKKKHAMFKRAVLACLSAAGREAARDETNKDRFYNYIFEQIVRPLDHYAEFPQFLGPPTAETVAEITVKRPQKSMFDWKQGHTLAEDKTARVRDFTENMESFCDMHIRSEREGRELLPHLCEKVRIAIIDSGVSLSDPIIRSARQRGDIRSCRNFSPGNSDPKTWEDTVGHGTMVARLLMEVAPEAEIYIAKVTGDGEQHIPKDELFCIARAINWAVQVWKVDIINMSFALRETNPDIDEAIQQALDPTNVRETGATRKIIFAAAGNNKGGNTRPSWPASRNGVIAIHATDGLGTPVNINPSSTGGDCFATLGSNIPYTVYEENKDGDDDDKEIYISGTSFATPVAAGIAANVLEYARRHIHDLNEDRKKELYSGPCMKRIFRAMSQKRGDYHYVQPWTFWEERIRGGWWGGNEYPQGHYGNVSLALKHIIFGT